LKIIYKPAKVWYLEIKNPKCNHSFNSDFKIEKQFPVDLSEYRRIYTKIGGPWDWANRLVLIDQELKQVLDDPQNEINYTYYKDKLAGYFELDAHHNDLEVVYFGLAPEFIGKGLGKEMMQHIFKIAQDRAISRLWLHTCEFDSPQALNFYLKSGFTIYDEKIEDQTIIQKD